MGWYAIAAVSQPHNPARGPETLLRMRFITVILDFRRTEDQLQMFRTDTLRSARYIINQHVLAYLSTRWLVDPRSSFA